MLNSTTRRLLLAGACILAGCFPTSPADDDQADTINLSPDRLLAGCSRGGGSGGGHGSHGGGSGGHGGGHGGNGSHGSSGGSSGGGGGGDQGSPPAQPSHEPPPPPPPIPDGDIARGGYIIPNGFWKSWRARTHSQGSNCTGTPCIRFWDRQGYGAFAPASQAMRFIDNDGADGSVSFRIRFHEGQLFPGGQGRHLFNITSLPLAFTPPEIGLDNWTRVDFERPNVGQVRAVIFNKVDGEPINGGYWPNHTYDVPFAVDSWGAVEISWHQANDRLTLTVNGASRTFDLLPGSPPVGRYIAFGNVYGVTGEMDVDDISWSTQL